MLSEIDRYIESPADVQQEYLENAKNETSNGQWDTVTFGSSNIGIDAGG